MNFKKAFVILTAAFATACEVEPVDQALLNNPAPAPVTEEPTTPVNPGVVSDTATVFIRDLIVDQENRTNAQLLMEQLDVDYASVPVAQVLGGFQVDAASATHEIKIVRDASATTSALIPTDLGGFMSKYGNPTYTNALNHNNSAVPVRGYLSRKDHGIVAEGIYTNPTTGVKDTIRAHVVRFEAAEFVKVYTAGPVNPLNPGTTVTTSLVINPAKNKVGQQGRIFTFTP